MANLKEVRERISSVISTQQITKAMKMVAAAKLRRAQQAIVEMRPYSNKLSAMLSNILSNLEGDASTSFGVERPVKNALVVVITSNRGLCGGFNTNVSKLAIELSETKYELEYNAGNLTYLFIGKKGYDYLKSRVPNAILNTEHMGLVTKTFGFEDSSRVASELMSKFETEQYDAIDIVYAQFKNAAIQNFTVEPFLPVAKLEVTEDGTDENADFIFEPNKEDLLDYLVPTILKTQLHKTILDSNASEQGARMTAMENATENAEDLLKELKINYNKARQEAITAEISEIVGGVAALEDA
ncbi:MULTISPECIES: ATP synthase F1 subunit gamma [unclassified Aureispira]|uniref:ATP synthase F1 subunit gamma n=1 Tax=unclassified Aureispira TaxID=2649989 RepID=UPI0006968ECE|nr:MULTISPECIES: ATP synthase F1 subunit gamma [unclassified Aureispira]WMX15786.1 ATP synthase F1 subunit gamma [Aureispira sp. CCB-E]